MKLFYLHIHLAFLDCFLYLNIQKSQVAMSNWEDKDGITNAIGTQASDILISVLLACICEKKKLNI